MKITNFQQAMAFANSDVGKRLPLFRLVDDAKYYFQGTGSRSRTRGNEQAKVIANFERARQDPVGFTKATVNNVMAAYLQSYRAYQGDPHPQIKSELNGFKNDLNKAANFLVENQVPASEIQNIFVTAQQNYKNQVEKSIQLSSKQNLFDKIFAVTDSLIVGGLTGGLGLSPVNAAALSSALAIANGAPVDKALQAGLAGLAAGQVGQYLQTVKTIAQNDLVNAAVTNAGRQATAALITGGDVKTAALSGLAGGATAQQLFRATDAEAISRAAGEYTQAVAAGLSPQQAMMSALTGFADTELQAAKQNIEDEVKVRQATKTATTQAPDIDVATPRPPEVDVPTTAGTTTPPPPPSGTAALPEVTVTASRLPDALGTNLNLVPTQITRPSAPTTTTPTPSLPEVQVTAEKEPEKPVGAELSTPKAPGAEQEPKKVAEEPEVEPGVGKDKTILLSLLGPASSTYFLGDRGGGSGMAGSAALSQALSVGDPGALYLGKKGKERKPVWNVESLKLKDELGGDYG